MTNKNMTPLQGLHIVVTRPAHQAQELIKLIASLSGHAISFPALEILYVSDKNKLQAIVDDLDKFQLLIFTSSNAVLGSVECIQQRWPILPAKLKIASVGSSTAKCLQSYNFPVHFYPQQHFDSEHLLALPELQQVAGQSIVLFSGEGGRDVLINTLQERGAKVVKAEVYRRIKPNADGKKLLPYWQTNTLDIIVSTSNESLQNLYDIVDSDFRTHLLQTSLLVISERMQALAKSLGFKADLVLAENATDSAIITALIKWKDAKYG